MKRATVPPPAEPSVGGMLCTRRIEAPSQGPAPSACCRRGRALAASPSPGDEGGPAPERCESPPRRHQNGLLQEHATVNLCQHHTHNTNTASPHATACGPMKPEVTRADHCPDRGLALRSLDLAEGQKSDRHTRDVSHLPCPTYRKMLQEVIDRAHHRLPCGR